MNSFVLNNNEKTADPSEPAAGRRAGAPLLALYSYIINRILPTDLQKVSGCDRTTARIRVPYPRNYNVLFSARPYNDAITLSIWLAVLWNSASLFITAIILSANSFNESGNSRGIGI